MTNSRQLEILRRESLNLAIAFALVRKVESIMQCGNGPEWIAPALVTGTVRA